MGRGVFCTQSYLGCLRNSTDYESTGLFIPGGPTPVLIQAPVGPTHRRSSAGGVGRVGVLVVFGYEPGPGAVGASVRRSTPHPSRVCGAPGVVRRDRRRTGGRRPRLPLLSSHLPRPRPGHLLSARVGGSGFGSWVVRPGPESRRLWDPTPTPKGRPDRWGVDGAIPGPCVCATPSGSPSGRPSLQRGRPLSGPPVAQ